MRKTITLIFSAVCALAMSATVFAGSLTTGAEKSVTINDIGITVTMSGFDQVITRDTVYDQEQALAQVGYAADNYLTLMQAQDLYLDAWDNAVTKELTATYNVYEQEGMDLSFNNLTEKELLEFLDEGIAQGQAGGLDASLSDAHVYQTKNGDMYYGAKVDASVLAPGTICYSYTTVRNNRAYNYALKTWDGTDPRSELQSILEKVEYAQPVTGFSRKSGLNPRLLAIIIGAVVGAFVGGLMAFRRKKAAEQAAQSNYQSGGPMYTAQPEQQYTATPPQPGAPMYTATPEQQYTATPAQPTEPQYTATAETPEAPEQPVTPVTPAAPEAPAQPATPEQPEAPAAPAAPAQPTAPETPADPDALICPVCGKQLRPGSAFCSTCGNSLKK